MGGRVNTVEVCFRYMYEMRSTKPFEIVLRREKEE
jgi:hypothetical protein